MIMKRILLPLIDYLQNYLNDDLILNPIIVDVLRNIRDSILCDANYGKKYLLLENLIHISEH